MIKPLQAIGSMFALLSRCALKPIVSARPSRLQCSNNLTSAIGKNRVSQYIRNPSSKCFGGHIRYHSNLIDTQFKPIMPETEQLSAKLVSNGTDASDKSIQEMDYKEALKDLNTLQSNNSVLGLAKNTKPKTILPLFKKQLELAGINIDRLDNLNAIHISGTKGKGSTCAFLESILLANSVQTGSDIRPLKVGSYNSPHLVHVTERIRLNGQPIEKALFVKHFRYVFNRLKVETEREQLPMPGYFSFLTILAFHIFLEEKVDCAIIEVGIGGEYDPTNILRRPVACAITTLDLDHTNILGKTIESIAWTKAGIIKTNAPLFTSEHNPAEAIEMIKIRAKQVGSPVYLCGPLDVRESGKLGIQGPAQSINASIACKLAFYLLEHLRQTGRSELNQSEDSHVNETNIDINGKLVSGRSFEILPDSFKGALSSARLPGRCQMLESKDLVFFLDGAHTKKSMENCVQWFHEVSPPLIGQKRSSKYLMINVIGERDKGEVLKPLLDYHKHFDKIIFTSNRIYPASQFDDSCTLSSATFAKVQDSSHEKGLENVLNNARVWQDLVRTHGHSDCATPVLVRLSVMEGIQAILTDEETLSQSNCDQDKGRNKPHVLATGSLHFVGAILDTIEKLGAN